jgi:hypothetical protein
MITEPTEKYSMIQIRRKKRLYLTAFAGLSMFLGAGPGLLRANDIIVCKLADATSPAHGTFQFLVDSTPFSLVVGGDCAKFPSIGAGPHTVTEAGQNGVVVSNITVNPQVRLDSFDLAARTVTAEAVDMDPATTITFYNKEQTGTQGCTPGFYKNPIHFGFWVGYSPTQKVSTLVPGAVPSLLTLTLAEALDGGGGSGLAGKETILIRAAVAALLNASNGNVSYAFTTATILSSVNAAINSGNLTTIGNLATQLDNVNNGTGGCPLSGHNPL